MQFLVCHKRHVELPFTVVSTRDYIGGDRVDLNRSGQS